MTPNGQIRTNEIVTKCEEYRNLYNFAIHLVTVSQTEYNESRQNILGQLDILATSIKDRLSELEHLDEKLFLKLIEVLPQDRPILFEGLMDPIKSYPFIPSQIVLLEDDLWNIGHWGTLETFVRTVILNSYKTEINIVSSKNLRKASHFLLEIYATFSFVNISCSVETLSLQKVIFKDCALLDFRRTNTLTYNQRNVLYLTSLQRLTNMWLDSFGEMRLFRPQDTIIRHKFPPSISKIIGNRWIAILHVRDHGYRNEHPERSWSRHRSSTLSNYIDACAYIYSKGGVVIRMGNPNMIPAPQCEYIFDYAHFPERNGEIELMFLSSAQLFLGGSSGLQTLISAFGVPRVHLDVILWDTLDIATPHEVILPKIYLDSIANTPISLSRYVDPNLRSIHQTPEFTLKNLKLEDVDSASITLAVQEQMGDMPYLTDEQKSQFELEMTDFYKCLEPYAESALQYRIASSFWRRFQQKI